MRDFGAYVKGETQWIIDEHCSITEFVDTAFDMADAKGWYDDEKVDGSIDTRLVNVPEKIALMHSELSEALEAWRDKGMEDWTREDGKPEGIGSELADVVIRIFDFCGAFDIDLAERIVTKMNFNATRPHRHGGKRA